MITYFLLSPHYSIVIQDFAKFILKTLGSYMNLRHTDNNKNDTRLLLSLKIRFFFKDETFRSKLTRKVRLQVT